MNDSSFSLSGWHFIDDKWRNEFDSCHDSSIDNLFPELLVNCDLHGYARIDMNAMFVLDAMFTKHCIDLKMSSTHSISDTIVSLCNKSNIQYASFAYACAQVLVISDGRTHSKYMYMSMTNDKFWTCSLDDAFIKLMHMFGVSNIGGMVMKAGCYTAIDEIFKGPLHGIDH